MPWPRYRMTMTDKELEAAGLPLTTRRPSDDEQPADDGPLFLPEQSGGDDTTCHCLAAHTPGYGPHTTAEHRRQSCGGALGAPGTLCGGCIDCMDAQAAYYGFTPGRDCQDDCPTCRERIDQ